MKCVVIGLGRFGRSLAAQLRNAGAEVIAIDSNAELVDEVREDVDVAVRLDATDEDELRSQGLEDVAVAVVAIGAHFESAALATALLKKIGVRRVIARSTSTLRGRILRLIGADDVVSPEEEAARQTAQRILRPALADFLKLSAARSVVEVIAPRSTHGATLKEADLGRRYRVQVLGIKRGAAAAAGGDDAGEQARIDAPEARTPINPGDRLIVIGADADLERLVREAERDI